MKRSGWRVLALGVVMGAVALPASAQVVIGGSSPPDVEVNWSVLDQLGRPPTLADMLKSEASDEIRLTPGNSRKAQAGGVQYRPYKPGSDPYAKPKRASKAKPAKPAKGAAVKPEPKSSVVPASAKTDPVADLVQSSQRAVAAQPAVPPKPPVAPEVELPKVDLPAAPKVAATEAPKVDASKAEAPKVEAAKAEAPPAAAETPKAETPKTETPKVEEPKAETAAPAAPPAIGPQVAVPEAPKPAAAPVAPPVQMAKAEAPLPLAPTALTPPPLPAAKVEAPVEPAPQVASLPATPAPAVAASPRGGDTLTVPFAADSARLPENVLADLDALARRMLKDDNLGLQLLAYANGDEANASKARRLSLSRALEVRKYLMEQGLRSTRIEVRALGNKIEGNGPADRVDAVLVGR